MKIHFRYTAILVTSLVACNSPIGKKQQTKQSINVDTKSIDTFQLELADSSKLTHIKGPFYKSVTGHLYERTFTQREVNGIDSLVTIEYFNGLLPQCVDPLTFQELDGWFAKDKNFAYYYRPTSGGMLIAKLEKAEANTFKVLKGHYKYAVDKNYVFYECDILETLNPTTLKIEHDKNGKIIKLICGKKNYTIED